VEETTLMSALLDRPSLGREGWTCLDGVDPRATSGLATKFRTARPFPHLVLDGLFDADLLREIAQSFGDVPAGSWGRSSHLLQRKLGTVANASLPPAAARYFENIHSAPMRRFLSRITGVEGLQADPTLRHGGMHEVPQGGSFELHVDFAHHPETLLRNRLVVITYLNEGWQADFGGQLELWSWKPRLHAASILPLLGRTIIMEVGPRNVHGHPTPVHAPDGRPRRSVAAYFYTERSPEEDGEGGPDVTGYVDHPGARLDVRAVRLLQSILPHAVASRARGRFGRR
jgi:hypothetical protein